MIPNWRQAMQGGGGGFGMLMPSQLPGMGGQGAGGGQMQGMLSPYMLPGFQAQQQRPQAPAFQPAPPTSAAPQQAAAQPPTPLPMPAMPASFGAPADKMAYAQQVQDIGGQNAAAQAAWQAQQPGAQPQQPQDIWAQMQAYNMFAGA